MNSEPVRQLGPLFGMFGEALRGCRPESVAILGVAGGERPGNGLTRRLRTGFAESTLNPNTWRPSGSVMRPCLDWNFHSVDLAERVIELAAGATGARGA